MQTGKRKPRVRSGKARAFLRPIFPAEESLEGLALGELSGASCGMRAASLEKLAEAPLKFFGRSYAPVAQHIGCQRSELLESEGRDPLARPEPAELSFGRRVTAIATANTSGNRCAAGRGRFR